MQMDRRLLKAATSGDSASMQAMASQDLSILLGTTPQGNTCLHISSIHGHEGFCVDVIALEDSLLAQTNLDGETPLVAAVRSGSVAVASALLGRYRVRRLSEAILEKDKDGCSALHHAICSGDTELALELIEAEPALSKGVNNFGDSPMYVAAARDLTSVALRLLEIGDSDHGGQFGYNALHSAVRNGNSVIVKRIMAKRPGLAKEAHKRGYTPMCTAMYRDKIDMLRLLLEHDPALGYDMTSDGYSLLQVAAHAGHVATARELLKHCPDAPCRGARVERWTCLHTSVYYGHLDFVKFVLATPQLGKLVNMQDNKGRTALHLAVENCDPKVVAALLSHKDTHTHVMNNNGTSPAWVLSGIMHRATTLNWNEVMMLMLRADPQSAPSAYNLHVHTTRLLTDASRMDAKSLTKTYTTNTSLVAILITTITFAAAFTLPGGYSSATGSEGLPIMSQKAAFKAFIISDTLAMCSSFVVAFICIVARWKDYEFLIYYRSFTRKLMWFAYVATTTAFSTGLYTVLAQRLHWLSISICVLVALLPILTKLLGEWPYLKIRFGLGRTFSSDLLDMV
ncbi:hypothetical protein CFC21_020532 [Triticum aestivum]|uniref:PGG domain-containing protein n=3 Tax=Triticum TaxID=4564 RepID=A0A9R1PB09_TRITD|nr:ankyrin repeat-containing protein NPR4-like [Triticum aestivum]XP_044318859.1 ankyrin repeat-containing protein NPR4-like [Triticum aestivum]KAF7005406.1 hypothetical protein CFC21_020532 [Triticum aestivum]VAH40015.1 unnamed protein product [Triticum turgidum subsp. durum]